MSGNTAAGPPRGARFFSGLARRPAAIGVFLAAILAAWLRLHGLGVQIVQDDEWHAIWKLLGSGYGDIATSFGGADHSIPLTLFYKLMADTFGLSEGRLRALQVASGVALVPLVAGLAWRARRDAPATVLLAVLVAAAPFLVLYSRFARPYAITLLLTVVMLAAAWCWRARRDWRTAGLAALAAALSAWLHPVSAAFPATACLYLFAADLLDPDARARGAWRGSLAFGLLVAVAMLLPLAPPLANDWASIAGKAGRDSPGAFTLFRALSIFFGGIPPVATALAGLIAVAGAVVLVRQQRGLGLYLVALAIVPVGLVLAAHAQWSQQGHTFARYVLPVQLILLFWASVGVTALARRSFAARAEPIAWVGSAALAAAYLAATPAIEQVSRLGAWYGHIYHHYDYDPRYNLAAAQYRGHEPPAFYRTLAALPPGSAPIVEAPFSVIAPANPFAYYATFHHQPEKVGMLHGVCLEGPRDAEPPPRDRRLRFRQYLFLEDVAGVRQSGARYLLLHREQRNGVPFRQAERCIAALTRLYGAPVSVDSRLAVFAIAPS